MARYLSLILLLAICCVASNATAHGGIPLAEDIHVFDDDWVFVTNFGAITSTDQEHYVCEEAFFGNDRFAVAPLGMDEWVTFTRSTVARTTDGCDFEGVHDLPTIPTDVAALPESGEVVYTVQNDGVAEIWHSADRGITWTLLDEDLTGIRPSSIGFLGPQHLVLIGYVTDEGDDLRGAPVIVDLNLDTGERTDHRPDDELRFPNLLDARNGNFLWHARRGDFNEIYWSRPDDIEFGFFSVGQWPNSGTLSPDGNRAYLGGVDENDRGVFSATSEDPEIWTEYVPDHRALCLAAVEDGLYICGHRDHDQDLSFFNLDGEAQKVIDFRDIQSHRTDCPTESSVAQTCPAVWDDLARALEIVSPVAPGDSDADNDQDEEDLDNPDLNTDDSEGGLCSTTPQRPSPEFLLLLLAAALVISRRHNRSAAPHHSPENS